MSWWRRSKGDPTGPKTLLPTDDTRIEQGNGKASTAKVATTLRLESLQRGDLGDEIGCEATNNELKPPMETSFKINMMRKIDYFSAVQYLSEAFI